MIMKIINTAREITFFAGSKPGILRFKRRFRAIAAKKGTRVVDWAITGPRDVSRAYDNFDFKKWAFFVSKVKIVNFFTFSAKKNLETNFTRKGVKNLKCKFHENEICT